MLFYSFEKRVLFGGGGDGVRYCLFYNFALKRERDRKRFCFVAKRKEINEKEREKTYDFESKKKEMKGSNDFVW